MRRIRSVLGRRAVAWTVGTQGLALTTDSKVESRIFVDPRKLGVGKHSVSVAGSYLNPKGGPVNLKVAEVRHGLGKLHAPGVVVESLLT